jgi:signal transduction histidine kinase
MSYVFGVKFSVFFNASLSTHAFKPASLIFPILFLIVMVFISIKHIDFAHQKEIFRNRWLYILGLLVLPFLFAFVRPFDGQVLGYQGEYISPIVPLLSLVPLTIAVGTVGPLAAIFLGILTGIGQMLLFGQDLSAVLFYPGMPLLFAVLINLTPEDTTNWRTIINKVFEAGMLSLPFWMLWQFNLAFVHGSKDVIAILSQSIFMWVTHLPELIVSGVALYFFIRFFKDDWKPKHFLLDQGVGGVFSAVLEQINQLSTGNFDYQSQVQPRTSGEKALLDAVENLRQSFKVRTDTQARLLSVDPTHYSREGYDLVMASILRAALTRDASSARIVLLESSPINRKQEMRLRTGQGEQTRNYAYLDPLILEKLADQEQLVLSNIKIDQYFGLTPGTPYPQALIALKLDGGNLTQGILWVGFEKNRWISNEELELYKELAYRASATLKTKEQILKVRTEKAWLSELLSAIPDPIMVVDQTGMILYQNLASKDLVGDSVGLTKEGPGGLQIIQSRLVELTQSSRAAKKQNKTIILSNQKEYGVDVYPVKLEGKDTGTIIYLKDYHWVNQANKEKNEFVSNISHDLRSPLKLMKGYTSLIKHIGNLSDQQEVLVNRLEAGIDDMKCLVNKVLDMERLDADIGLVYTTFDMKEMIIETIAMLNAQAQQKKISVNTDLGTMKAPYISADRILIQQAIYNLLENAIKFSPRGETILIKAEKDASWMHVSVQDHGKGIAPLDQSRIFDRFFFMDDEPNFDNRGQGLGLAIVKSIAEKHGGAISVESKLGVGSQFSFDIPLHRLEGMKKTL